jgi:hypothetical protein
VIVNYFNVFGAGGRPVEADAISIVDSDAPLASPVAMKGLKSVARRYPEVFKRLCDLQLPQLPASRSRNRREPGDSLTLGQRLRVAIFERDNQGR